MDTQPLAILLAEDDAGHASMPPATLSLGMNDAGRDTFNYRELNPHDCVDARFGFKANERVL